MYEYSFVWGEFQECRKVNYVVFSVGDWYYLLRLATVESGDTACLRLAPALLHPRIPRVTRQTTMVKIVEL